MLAAWDSPQGGTEYALSFDRGREHRLLVVPALFDEANKTRHLLVESLRRLDAAGIDSFLPDLPGWNESLAPFEAQTFAGWREAAEAAAEQFRATHVLGVRGGALLLPAGLPGWRYAPVAGASLLKAMLRARTIAAREFGEEESSTALLEAGREAGLELAGYRLGAPLVCELEAARVPDRGDLSDIAQSTIGGGAPWLRAEPGFDARQADALAAVIAMGIGG